MEQLENDNLRDMISSMISLNPAERRSADVYLDEERGRLFPDYFYTFLQSYMQIFSSLQILPADEKIMRLSSDIEQIIGIFTPKPDGDEEKTDERPIPIDDGLIIITAVVTSCIRGLKYCMTKLRCLEILQQLSMYTTSETVLDRILPYIVSDQLHGGADNYQNNNFFDFRFGSCISQMIHRLGFEFVPWTLLRRACVWSKICRGMMPTYFRNTCCRRSHHWLPMVRW